MWISLWIRWGLNCRLNFKFGENAEKTGESGKMGKNKNKIRMCGCTSFDKNCRVYRRFRSIHPHRKENINHCYYSLKCI